jgi:phosphoglycerol transferase MdoB-like AlkP superfamily enzyme
MNNKKLTVILQVIVTSVVVAFIGLILATFILPPPQTTPPPIPEPDRVLMDIYLKVKTMISLVNIVFIISLMSIYYGIYRQVKSKFTMGLIIVMLVLLMYALSSNPIIHVLFGYQAQGLGPFAMMPDIFTTIALGVLLYISLD